MKRLAWVLPVAALVAAVALLLKPPSPNPEVTAVLPKTSPSVPPSQGPSLGSNPGTPVPPLRPHPASRPLADLLNAPAADPAQDVATLHRIIVLYQRALHNRQGTPIGDDIDLARALTGHNPMRQTFLPPDHPALSANGHLIDRWGTPYHLHPRGNGAYEVRSAGPDRQLFTSDDLIANPPAQSR